jgi:protein-disulfide isomerase
MKAMNNDIKIFGGIILATIILIVGAVFLMSQGESQTSNNRSKQALVPREILVRKDSWSTGTPSAKVTVVEFADFQCPTCKVYESVINEVKSKYKNEVLFVFRQFPLAQVHPYAMSAALAAHAAGNQGKFWEMASKLYDKQPSLKANGKFTDEFKKENLISYAKQMNLDIEKFTKDFDSDSALQHVLNDIADGNKIGVSGTPTFFINGRQFQLNELKNISDFSSKIDPLLK